MGTCPRDWGKVRGEERRWTKIHQPVFGLEACPGYVEAYIPREIHFFFNPMFLDYVYVVLWFVTRLKSTQRPYKYQSSFVQKMTIRFEIMQVNTVCLLMTSFAHSNSYL